MRLACIFSGVPLFHAIPLFLAILLVFTRAAAAEHGWEQTTVLAAPEAHQAAVADDRFVYAINNTTVARYDRETGQRLAVSHGPAKHLNSGFFHEGKIYCAHSNYPQQPEQSDIRGLDLETMELTLFKDFGASPHGSLTWAIYEDDHWWCNFAHYGEENRRTVLVRFDRQWRERGSWTYPPEVLSELGRYSISGGIWRDGLLLTTGHDKQELYRLRLPENERVLEYVDTVPAPFTGQGIAVDLQTNGILGIDRAKRQIVFAELRKEGEVLEVEGLQSPVEILVDRWGVAHIYAENEADLFFAQGYHAARDRLFQFEIWRRQATGTVAEILGPRELDRDIGARLLRFRGDLQQELNHYHPRGEQIINAFTRGINAWIARTERDPDLLPLEFRLLDIRPGRWTPEVVVSRHQGLLHNLSQELELGRAVALLGEEQVKELVWFHPGQPELTLDDAIDGKLLSADILKHYHAARSPLEFRPEDVPPQFRAEQVSQVNRTVPGRSQLEGADIGSNNWVVSGLLSETGSPLMVNDPHRVLHVPSLRYFSHLVAPGWNVIGGGEPTLPGVSIGHNGFGAWGLTIFRIDAEDLYVYQTHRDDPLKYRYQDGWESMTVITESIPVKDAEPVPVELKFTRHGPVLYQDTEHGVAYALRAGWLEVGGAPYLASLRMNQAGSWEEFRDACSYSHIPGENMVWADRDGNIGWQAVGIAPLRPNWDGLVPVPGDGRYEWDGYLPGRELPHVFNPARGFWNTSNENLVPPGYPHRRAVAWTWSDPYRGARVHEVLASGRKFNRTDMMRLQHDELSIPARSLVPLLCGLDRQLDAAETAASEAIGLLCGWDFVLDRQSVAAGIFVAWQRRLQTNMQELAVPAEARVSIGSLSMKRVLDWLISPDGRFGDHPVAGRDAFLLKCLREAVDELTERLGPEIDQWHYGQARYKHAQMDHPLSPAVNEQLRSRLNVGPLPRGGDSYTVNNTGGADNQPSGGTFRVIIDTGDWDASLATNAPGQGGDPEGAHYSDLFEMWATGRYFPLFYSRPKIESVRSQAIQLMPPRSQ